jgi:Nif-specific regulatory protein
MVIAVSRDSSDDLERARLERDLYWRLLELGAHEDLRAMLEEALHLIVEVTGASKGYLALYADDDDEPRFVLTKGLAADEITGVGRAVSTGVIAAAISTGRTILTASALDDPRFSDNRSVQLAKIGAVLCAPIGGVGVLYLAGSANDVFTDSDRERADAFARHLAPFVDRLIARERDHQTADPTQPFRTRLRLDGIVGRSAALAAVLADVESAARFDVNVVLAGPSGTGKTALARAIHNNSARNAHAFVELNCAAMPEPLFESELFGALPGAHSTATRRIRGKLAAAEGGTLLLDELTELGASAQAKLLQFLQSREYYPLGASKPERANVRLIAATNVDLEAAVRDKKFREDLYYRIIMLVVRVPPLEARREDIVPLANHFCASACTKHGIPPLSLSASAARAVVVADWPGNIRQLGHVIETAVIRAAVAKSNAVEIRHLFGDTRGEASTGAPETFQEATRRFQQQLVETALQESNWNVSEAARRLGLSRAHVHNLITSFELKR